MAVVFDEFDDLVKETLGFESWPKGIDTIYKKRIYLRQKIEFYRVKNKLPKILYQFLSDEQFKKIDQIDNFRRLQQLEHL